MKSIVLCSALLLTVGGITWYGLSTDEPTAPKVAVAPKTKVSRPSSSRPKTVNLDSLQGTLGHWENRLDKIREIPSGLSDQEIRSLFALINQLDQNRNEEQILMINEIMEVLEQKYHNHPVFIDSMLEIVASPQRQDTVRDYAIQHVVKAVVYDPAKEGATLDASAVASLAQKHQVFESILTQLNNPSNAQSLFVGTGINMLGESLDEFKLTDTLQQSYDQLLTQVVTGEKALSNYSRITTIQIAARTQGEKLAPVLRELINDDSQSLDVHISAVAGLGITGDAQDLALLTEISNSSQRSKYAAKAAITKIQSKALVAE